MAPRVNHSPPSSPPAPPSATASAPVIWRSISDFVAPPAPALSATAMDFSLAPSSQMRLSRASRRAWAPAAVRPPAYGSRRQSVDPRSMSSVLMTCSMLATCRRGSRYICVFVTSAFTRDRQRYPRPGSRNRALRTITSITKSLSAGGTMAIKISLSRGIVIRSSPSRSRSPIPSP